MRWQRDGERAATRGPHGPVRGSQSLRLGLGVLLGSVAVWFALSAAGGWRAISTVLVTADPRWVAAAVLAQVLGLTLSVVRLRRLAGPEAQLDGAAAARLELVMNGLAVLAPAAPAEGLAYGARQLRRRGLDRTRTGLVLVLEQWFSFRAAYLVASLNLLVILARRDFPVPGPWPGVAAVLVLLVLAATAAAASRPATMQHLNGAWARVRFWAPRPSAEERALAGLRLYEAAMGIVGRPRDRMRLAGLSVAGHLATVLTLLLALRSVGVVVAPDVAVLATGAAMLASSIPLLPVGLGMVEAAVPAVLAWYGAPLAHAVAGVVVARVVSTVLPAVAGAVALWSSQLAPGPGPAPGEGLPTAPGVP